MNRHKADHPKPPKRKHPRAYPPVKPEYWNHLVGYLRQVQAFDRSGQIAPIPDASLLEAGPFGSFAYIRLGKNAEGHDVAFFKIPPHTTKERSAPARVMLMLLFLLAFRPSCSANDNGQGWSYVRLWGNDDRHQLGRLIKNAQPGDVVVQRKGPDYRKQEGFGLRSAKAFTEETGKPVRQPYTGRTTAVAVALKAYERRAKRSRIEISAEGYEALLWEAFAVLDAEGYEELI